MGDELRTKIVYKVNTGSEVYNVSSWDTTNVLPIHQPASIYVSVRAFVTKSGVAYSLEHATGSDVRGEEF